ncbi:MAG TPA: crosslink repair DNA glycosylase YcaQ family protein, partial [Trebonia sp.]
MAPGQLSRRLLNRTLLRRQLLDEPSPLAVPDAVRQVAGLQAQIPRDPYIGLWSRLAGFTRDDLASAISGRQLVRVALMRSTIHLVTAADCQGFRPAVQPALDRELFTTATWSRPIAGLDLAAVLAEARDVLKEQPMTA